MLHAFPCLTRATVAAASWLEKFASTMATVSASPVVMPQGERAPLSGAGVGLSDSKKKLSGGSVEASVVISSRQQASDDIVRKFKKARESSKTRTSSTPKHKRRLSAPVINGLPKNAPATPVNQKQIISRKSVTPGPAPKLRGAGMRLSAATPVIKAKRRSSFAPGGSKPASMNVTPTRATSDTLSLPKGLDLDVENIIKTTKSKAPSTRGKSSSIHKSPKQRTDPLSVSDHGAISNKGKEKRQQSMVLLGRKAGMSPKAASSRQLLSTKNKTSTSIKTKELPEGLALDMEGIGASTKSKTPSTSGKPSSTNKSQQQRIDPLSASDHDVISKNGREGREQPIAAQGRKSRMTLKTASSTPLSEKTPPTDSLGGGGLTPATNPKAHVLPKVGTAKKTRSKSVMVPGSDVSDITVNTAPISPKRHSIQVNKNRSAEQTQIKYSKIEKPNSKTKLKVTIEETEQDNDDEAKHHQLDVEKAAKQRKTRTNNSPPPEQKLSENYKEAAAKEGVGTSKINNSTVPSSPQSPRKTRKMKSRKSTMDAITSATMSDFKSRRPSLNVHLKSPMGNKTDVGVYQRTRLTSDDVSAVRELNTELPPMSSNRNNSVGKSKDRESVSASLTFFGDPVVPLDIVDNTSGLTLKLNLMHHKDALQVLDEIKGLQRGQLNVKVKSDAALFERIRKKRPLERKQTVDLKCIQILKTAGNSTSATLSMTGFKGGELENQINQDRSLIVAPFYLQNHNQSTIPRRLVGVFDGHAVSGAKFAEHCQQQLPGLIARKLSEAFKKAIDDMSAGVAAKKGGEDEVGITKRVLIESFVAMDKSAPKEDSGGCTATVIYQQGQRVFVANAGDSRSIIAVYRKTIHNRQQQHENKLETDESGTSKTNPEKYVKVAYISREDKPDDPDEQKRLENHGGDIIPAEKNKSSKVRFRSNAPGKASATLGMSRSIGDWQFTPLGVIPDPIVDVVDLKDVVRKELKEKDTEDDVCIFAICVTDGMMIGSNEEAESLAAEIAPSLFQDHAPHPLTVCQSEIKKAAAVWEKRNKSKFRDDITIAVTVLRSPADAINSQLLVDAAPDDNKSVDLT